MHRWPGREMQPVGTARSEGGRRWGNDGALQRVADDRAPSGFPVASIQWHTPNPLNGPSLLRDPGGVVEHTRRAMGKRPYCSEFNNVHVLSRAPTRFGKNMHKLIVLVIAAPLMRKTLRAFSPLKAKPTAAGTEPHRLLKQSIRSRDAGNCHEQAPVSFPARHEIAARGCSCGQASTRPLL